MQNYKKKNQSLFLKKKYQKIFCFNLTFIKLQSCAWRSADVFGQELIILTLLISILLVLLTFIMGLKTVWSKII